MGRAKKLRPNTVRSSEALIRRSHDWVLRDAGPWRDKAGSLMRAASALLPLYEADNRQWDEEDAASPSHPVFPVYMMLTGLAVENLAKALLIKAGRPFPRNHNIPELLRQTRLTWSAEELYLAEKLESFAVWAGRYPIPLDVEDQLLRKHPKGGFGPINHFLSSDPDEIKAMVAKLEAAL